MICRSLAGSACLPPFSGAGWGTGGSAPGTSVLRWRRRRARRELVFVPLPLKPGRLERRAGDVLVDVAILEPARERFSEVAHRVPATIEILLKPAIQDRPELGVAGVHLRDRHRVVRRDRIKNRVVVLPFEGSPPGHRLVEQDREGPDVGAMIDVVAPRLLGRHVQRTAEQRPGLRQPVRVLFLELRDAEIDELRLNLSFVVLREKDVLRLPDVAVNDAFVVSNRWPGRAQIGSSVRTALMALSLPRFRQGVR